MRYTEPLSKNLEYIGKGYILVVESAFVEMYGRNN